MLLIVDGRVVLDTRTESNMRPLIINCQELSAAEWNAPSALADRKARHNAAQARKASLAKLADLAPRKVSLVSRIADWLNKDVI